MSEDYLSRETEDEIILVSFKKIRKEPAVSREKINPLDYIGKKNEKVRQEIAGKIHNLADCVYDSYSSTGRCSFCCTPLKSAHKVVHNIVNIGRKEVRETYKLDKICFEGLKNPSLESQMLYDTRKKVFRLR